MSPSRLELPLFVSALVGVILAAGEGKRLRSITGDRPKGFLEIGGRRIIDYQIGTLRKNGLKDIVIVSGFRSDLFRKDYESQGIRIVLNPFYEVTNVLASLWFARGYLEHGFYFLHADTFFEPSIFSDMKLKNFDVLLCVQHKETNDEEMKVQVKNGLISGISKRMKTDEAYGEFTGIAKIRSKLARYVIERIEYHIESRGNYNAFFEVVFQDMINQGYEVNYLDIGDRISLEIDFPEDYSLAKSLFKKNQDKWAS